jgi:Phosphate-induced protein 1 conserved region
MPYTATLAEGCMTKQSPNNDYDADSTINVTSHEQMEAVTDPLINAWYDANQYEIGDKCAWNFGSVSLNGGKANVEWNGHYYLVQQEWSNARKGCTLQR